MPAKINLLNQNKTYKVAYKLCYFIFLKNYDIIYIQ